MQIWFFFYFLMQKLKKVLKKRKSFVYNLPQCIHHQKNWYCDDCQPEYSMDDFEGWLTKCDRLFRTSPRALLLAEQTWLLLREMFATKSGVPRETRSAKELAVRCCELHLFTTLDLLYPAVLASCKTLDHRRQSAGRIYDASSSQPSDEGAAEFMGTMSRAAVLGWIIDVWPFGWLACGP